jgi:hypothetical protein
VVLVPGPREEIAVVRRIFRRFVDGCAMAEIARELNRKGVLSARGGPWCAELVRRLLGNELMVGVYTFNRTCTTLRTSRRRNPPERWVRMKVMDPIIDPQLFRQAQRRIGLRPRECLTRQTMLQALRRLLDERGHLTYAIIKSCPYTPKPATYCKYFGSIFKAYEAIGFTPCRRKWAMHPGKYGATDDELVDLLKRAHRKHGVLRGELIDADPQLPSSDLYRSRFGSLCRAYELAGLPHTRSELSRQAHRRAVSRGRALTGPRTSRKTYSAEELIQCLRSLHARDGYVCVKSLRADPCSPHDEAFRRMFGSLYTAYELAGLTSNRREVLRAGMRRRREAMSRRKQARANVSTMRNRD